MRVVSFILLGVLVLTGRAHGQQADELQIKAVFIYNFTQFVDWPAEAFESSDAPFVIGVLGQNAMGKYLEEAVAGEHYKSRPIVVRYFATAGEVGKCQILYIGSQANPFRTTRQRLVLMIGERQDFLEQGGMFRFYKDGKKVRIEINDKAASDAGLNISSKLLQLATIYPGK